jgi:hypothetical protein
MSEKATTSILGSRNAILERDRVPLFTLLSRQIEEEQRSSLRRETECLAKIDSQYGLKTLVNENRCASRAQCPLNTPYLRLSGAAYSLSRRVRGQKLLNFGREERIQRHRQAPGQRDQF